MVAVSLFVCTRDGLVRLERDGRSWGAEPVPQVAADCVAADGARVLVGARGSGAAFSNDRGASWEPVTLPEPDV